MVEKPIVVVDPRVGSDERLSFTFFHEVSHHLIRTDDSLYEFLHEFAPGSWFETALERFCNSGAAEFLIPKDDVKAHIRERGFSIRMLESLEEKYHASKPAICIQLAKAASHKCVTVICEHGILSAHNDARQRLIDSGPAEPQLYILYAATSPTYKYWPGKYVPVPHQHLLSRAYYRQCYIEGRDYLLFKHREGWPVDCEAFFLKGRVYGVFNQTQPPSVSHLQLPLFDNF